MKKLAVLLLVASPLLAAPPPRLDPGLGSLHWNVTTKNAKAQAYFDQGMRYLYAFNHDAAIESFRYATTLDPDLAMGYWGVALALGPNINMDVDPVRETQAYEAEQQAMQHAPQASPRERDIIETLAKRYSIAPNADLKKLSADYSDGMDVLSKKYPDDMNIATLYAESLMDLRPWKFWSRDGKPADGTETIVAVLQSVLARDPNHLGANHYLIHALEASPHPDLASASAERLPKLAPSAGHLVHMPAHVLERTGNYAGAALANENAARVDRAFIKENGGDSMYAMMYYSHNLQFGAASYAMTGQLAPAMKMANELAKNAEPMLKMMPPLDVALVYPMQLLVRFGRWTDVLRSQPVDAGPLSATLSHFARGSALAQLGDVSGALSEQKAMEAARAKLTDDPGIMQNSPRDVAEVAAHVLAGRIALARGDVDAGIEELTKATAAEDNLGYDEPPDWWLPTRETLGAALLRTGHPVEAEAVFRADLKENPKNPRSLFGLTKALAAQKKDAAAAQAAFRRAWKGGELSLADF